ncbi:hypothetical protein [Aquirhabdus sp.]|uniref:hypothetical protein n=1 Tax=Aquirhabdus sp. TaxID=2824160 RepID=UPI00396C9823
MDHDAIITDPKEKLARQREAYIRQRMRQIKVWNMVGWLFWVFLAVICYWLYQQKPLYLNPSLLANQVQVGKMPSNEMAQLAALGGLLFWAFIALLAGFIFQIYTAMYSERKLIRLFSALHTDDLKQYEPRVEISDVASPNDSQS